MMIFSSMNWIGAASIGRRRELVETPIPTAASRLTIASRVCFTREVSEPALDVHHAAAEGELTQQVAFQG